MGQPGKSGPTPRYFLSTGLQAGVEAVGEGGKAE